MYEALRSESPVLWSREARSWLVFSHGDVRGALRDPALSSAARLAEMRCEFAAGIAVERAERIAEILAAQLESSDGEAHARLRRAFAPAFHRSVRDLERRLDDIVGGVISLALASTPVDLVVTVADRVPREVALEVLGVPPQSRAAFIDDVDVFLRHPWNPDLDGAGAEARLRSAIRAAHAGILEELAHSPRTISEDEVLANAILIVSAGHRTTANLLGRFLHSLLTDASVRSAAAVDANLPTVVDEILRLQSPIQTLQRTAVRRTSIGGVEICAGANVTLVVGAANRDPNAFGAPSGFDGRRSPNPHLAFGHGRHHCLGARLARLQAMAVARAVRPELRRLRVVTADVVETPEEHRVTELVVDQRRLDCGPDTSPTKGG